MNRMKAYIFGLFIFLQVLNLNDVIAQNSDCNDQLSYELIEGDNDTFNIQVKLEDNASNNFTLKLYNLSIGSEFIIEHSISKSNNNITFKNLNNRQVFLIQAISNNCQVTLGGMEGIKVENK